MDILETIVSREILAISQAPQYNMAHQWSVTVRANGKDFTPLYVKKRELDRLYNKSYSDVILVTVGFNFSDYQYGILPYKDQLEATMMRIEMNSNVNAEVVPDKARSAASYKAQLVDGNASAVGGDNPLTISKGMSNKSDIHEVTLQLFTKTIDDIRKKTFGGVITDVDPVEAICYVLLSGSKDASNEASIEVKGISIDPTFPASTREHLIIPHNTAIVDVPLVIDDQVSGVHPAQMRFYLQNNYWYLYPIFDHSRFASAEHSLTVIKIPKYRLPSVEKTFRIADGQIIVLSTSSTTHRDNSESQTMNTGNGVRFVDADYIMDNFGEVGNNKFVSSAKTKVSEVVFKPRADGSDMVTAPTATIITNNYNQEYAKLAAKSGSYIQTIWENCNVELLKPGMPLRYIFQDGEEVREMYGTLNAVEALDYNTNNTISNPRFVTMALLTLFVTSVSPLKSETDNATSTSTRST